MYELNQKREFYIANMPLSLSKERPFSRTKDNLGLIE